VLHQLHESLPSYQLLADSDVGDALLMSCLHRSDGDSFLQIIPSEDTTYSREELVNALSVDGLQPYVSPPDIEPARRRH
jgi:hypothetical protein